MKYVVDANILSELTKPAPSTRVVEGLRNNERELAISPIVLGELEFGILSLPRGRRRARLEVWFSERVQPLRVLDFDARTASTWAELLTRLRKQGLAMPAEDSLIAATALTHDLTVATRNTADFRHAGVRLVNPFEEESEGEAS